jgi:hypothetical protein
MCHDFIGIHFQDRGKAPLSLFFSLLLSFKGQFLTNVYMSKIFLGVSLRYRFGSGYTLAETWHATSVLHLLCKLRAFRCYPSRVNKVKNIALPCNRFFFKGIKDKLRGRGLRPRPRINTHKIALGMRRACVSMVQRTEAIA